MAGKAGQKKRFWSDDEKRSICEQTTTVGVSVAQVARRYGMNANLIHKWLRDPRFGPATDASDVGGAECNFLPIEVEASALAFAPVMEARLPQHSTPLSASRVDITLSDGRRVLVEGPTALTSVLGLVQGLMA
ncbi:MAG: transposase [Rhodobacteraceae bacterium]|nr:transposase [Paracoccaceae bacterium]